MQSNAKLAARLNNSTIWIYSLGGLTGAICLGFFPLAFLIWGLTFLIGSLFKAASVIIIRLDEIWFAMNPISESPVEGTQTDAVVSE